MRLWIFAAFSMMLVGCSSHRAPHPDARLSDSITVIAELNDQLNNWYGTPYRSGGVGRGGVDCSGFVQMTFRDRFAMHLPRQTSDQASVGTRIDKNDLLPGDLVFFKTGAGENRLHVGIYDTDNHFIHASTSKGVIRSSLDNVYWRKKFWQARRI